MVQILITQDGKYILAGAKGFLSMTPGTGGGSPPQDPGIPGTSGTTSLALTDFYAVAASVARPVVQRSALSMSDPNGPWGNVPVLFTFAGTAPQYPQACVIDASTGSVVKVQGNDWNTLDNISVVGSNGLGTLSKVPQGGYYYLKIRDGQQPGNAATSPAAGARQWGVGVCILAMGQSNMAGTFQGGAFNDPVPGTSTYEYDWFNQGKVAASLFADCGFYNPNPNGPGGSSNVPNMGGVTFSTMRILSDALKAKYGKTVPIALIPWAFNSTGITQYFPTGAKFSLLVNNNGTAYPNIGFKSPKNYYAGDFEGVLWHQGEANSDGSSTSAQHYDNLKTLYQGFLSVVAPFQRDANNLFFVPAVIGSYSDPGYMYIERIRKAVLDLERDAPGLGWPKVKAGWNCIDLIPQPGNELHFVDGAVPYQKMSGKRMQQAALYMLGCSSVSGIGPRVGAAGARSGNSVPVTILHEGGTSLTAPNGTNVSGFLANTKQDFTGASITVTAAIAGANTITVTFPNGTVYPTYLKYCGGPDGSAASQHPDASNLVYDNFKYPSTATGTDTFTGLPLLPTVDAITIN